MWNELLEISLLYYHWVEGYQKVLKDLDVVVKYVSTLFIEGVADPRKDMSLYSHRHSFSIKNYVYNTLFITNFCDIKPICFAFFLSFDCVHIQLTMGVTDSRILTSFFISINAPITTRIIQTIKLTNTEPRANTGPWIAPKFASLKRMSNPRKISFFKELQFYLQLCPHIFQVME